MEKFVTSLAIVVALVSAFVWGWFAGGRHSEKVVISKMETTTTDTLWEEVHDTAWVETSVKISRIDTVRLAYVPDSAVSGTFGVANGHENGISGTCHDTLFVHDSVYVEVPIETHTFLGDHYRITAHGYRVGLDDVWFDRQVITAKTTNTKYVSKRWNFNVGAQIGYGYTVHGASPYAGIGVAFGYTF